MTASYFKAHAALVQAERNRFSQEERERRRAQFKPPPKITDPRARGIFAVRRIDGWFQAHHFGSNGRKALLQIAAWDQMSHFKWPAAIVKVTAHFYYVIKERGDCIPQDFEHELIVIALQGDDGPSMDPDTGRQIKRPPP